MTGRSHRRHDEDGGTLILALGFVGFMLIPLFMLLVQMSVTASASVQAEGASYSVAFGLLTRSIADEATQTASQGGVLLYGRPVDEDGNPTSVAASQYGDAVAVLGYINQGNRFVSAWGGKLSLDAFPTDGIYNTPLAPNPTTDPFDPTFVAAPPGGGAPPDGASVGIINMPLGDIQARFANNAPGKGGTTTSCGDALVQKDGATGNTLCWRDLRAGKYTDSEFIIKAGAFDHFASGVQAQVRYRYKILSWDVSSSSVGVATFDRPCALVSTSLSEGCQ